MGTAGNPAGIPGFPDAVASLAGAGDMEEFARLQWRAFEPALHEPLEVLTQDVLGATTWLVRDSGRLVGSVRCEVHGEFAHLSLVMVEPDLQGRGVGRWLVGHAEEMAPPQVTAYQLFTAAGNVAFYAGLGYVAEGERETLSSVVRMGKDR
ncbi:GNAT family N-acetyltransferase [Nocardioides daedukensis]|uniref:GNAT family N-acetyltransferase n=1 Tax=Nocardioides daedukensis TaxID=634462 RepID=UPI0015CDB2B2